ncbi:energy-coupling factor transporter transmembrane protein EcfT [uncultured Methylobacterium sp.]|uniref:energy-coupling factor transporter transmembrane component T family protein n=1 Tax=uncultured Methylobacterium sp. TaxID=157278 RepID=UPI002597F00B|nr:energy-coupling factor transporter transmembrane protein EcfT [uncultured Methylobacterium sp.]
MSLSEYRPGTSFLHRAPAGLKLLGLLGASTALFLVPSLPAAGTGLVAALLLYASAGLGWRITAGQLRPMAWLLVVLFLVQLALEGWLSGLLVVVRLAALLLLASLVTLTTRSSDLIAALERALGTLRWTGLNPAKVSLAIALALRFIPVLADITAEVREAQKARGLETSIVAIAVPVIVRTLKMADDIAAAIEARSYDPDLRRERAAKPGISAETS